MMEILKKIFSGWNLTYLLVLGLFLIGYFNANLIFNKYIALAIIKGDYYVYHSMKYGKGGLLSIVLSFIMLSIMFFMSRTKESP